jgi:hypothetical protein
LDIQLHTHMPYMDGVDVTQQYADTMVQKPYIDGVRVTELYNERILQRQLEKEAARNGFRLWQSLPLFGVSYFETNQ